MDASATGDFSSVRAGGLVVKIVPAAESGAWVVCVKLPFHEGTSIEDYVMLDVAVLADPNLAARFPWDAPAKEDLANNRPLRVIA